MSTNEICVSIFSPISNIIGFHYRGKTVAIQLGNIFKMANLETSFRRACASGKVTLDHRTLAK